MILGEEDLKNTPLGGVYWSTAQVTEAPSEPKKVKKRKSVSPEKLFACDQCNYCCTQSSTLRIHQLTHTGEKPFACDQCDYRCTTSGNLRTHQMTHTGEKPFACDQCDFRCTTSSDLRIHQRTHTGEKPFVCDQCDYRCTQSGSLRNHQRTHTGESRLPATSATFAAPSAAISSPIVRRPAADLISENHP